MSFETEIRERLHAEARAARVSDDAWEKIRSRSTRRAPAPRRVAVLGAIAAVIALVVLVPTLLRGPEVTGPFTSTTPAPVFEPAADAALHCFLDARVRRDFTAARECMTDRLAATYDDPVEFIGASSPNIQRFTVHSDIRRDRTSLVVNVTAYIGTSTGLTHVSNDQVHVISDGDRWLVDGWVRDEERPIGETTTIRVYLGPNEALCDAITPDDFVAVDRVVPADLDLRRSVLEELLSGPTPADAARGLGSFFPLGSRFDAFDETESGFIATFNDVTDDGNDCVDELNRAVIFKTLEPFAEGNISIGAPLG